MTHNSLDHVEIRRRGLSLSVVAALVVGGAVLVACGGDDSMSSGADASEAEVDCELEENFDRPECIDFAIAGSGSGSGSAGGASATPTTISDEPDDDDAGEPLVQEDIERVEDIDECLLGLWQADNATWSALLGGLPVAGKDLWLLLANGISMRQADDFQLGAFSTLNALGQGSWAAKDGLIRWDDYDIYTYGTVEIPDAVRVDLDLTDISAVKTDVLTAGGIRVEAITDFSIIEDDLESENGPWTAPYTCEGDRFVLDRGEWTLVYNLVERW